MRYFYPLPDEPAITSRTTGPIVCLSRCPEKPQGDGLPRNSDLANTIQVHKTRLRGAATDPHLLWLCSNGPRKAVEILTTELNRVTGCQTCYDYGSHVLTTVAHACGFLWRFFLLPVVIFVHGWTVFQPHESSWPRHGPSADCLCCSGRFEKSAAHTLFCITLVEFLMADHVVGVQQIGASHTDPENHILAAFVAVSGNEVDNQGRGRGWRLGTALQERA